MIRKKVSFLFEIMLFNVCQYQKAIYICSRLEEQLIVQKSTSKNNGLYFLKLFLKSIAGIKNCCTFASAKRRSDSKT